MLQAVASCPSEQPTVYINMRLTGMPVRRHDSRGGKAASGPDPDQSHVAREVIIHGLTVDGLDEMDLGGPLAVQLAVEEIDHDLPREPVGVVCRCPSSLKICAQVRIRASFEELWMMVPEPKPTDPWARTRMRTTVSHGLGFSKTGSSSASSSRSGRAWVLCFLAFAAVSRSALAASASLVIVAVGVGS